MRWPTPFASLVRSCGRCALLTVRSHQGCDVDLAAGDPRQDPEPVRGHLGCLSQELCQRQHGRRPGSARALVATARDLAAHPARVPEAAASLHRLDDQEPAVPCGRRHFRGRARVLLQAPRAPQHQERAVILLPAPVCRARRAGRCSAAHSLRRSRWQTRLGSRSRCAPRTSA